MASRLFGRFHIPMQMRNTTMKWMLISLILKIVPVCSTAWCAGNDNAVPPANALDRAMSEAFAGGTALSLPAHQAVEHTGTIFSIRLISIHFMVVFLICIGMWNLPKSLLAI